MSNDKIQCVRSKLVDTKATIMATKERDVDKVHQFKGQLQENLKSEKDKEKAKQQKMNEEDKKRIQKGLEETEAEFIENKQKEFMNR